MNEAFNNPKGNFNQLDIKRIRKQCANIFDEYCELLLALGAIDDRVFQELHHYHVDVLNSFEKPGGTVDVDQIRDSLCDIQVFASGAQHLMGVNADDDMTEVVSKVMTRFIKSDEDKELTIKKHAAKGVTDVYFEGEYPTMVMKSASDQPDAPQGKFLKSASFQEPKFADPNVVDLIVQAWFDRRMAYVWAAEALKTEFEKLDDGSLELRLHYDTGTFKIKGADVRTEKVLADAEVVA